MTFLGFVFPVCFVSDDARNNVCILLVQRISRHATLTLGRRRELIRTIIIYCYQFVWIFASATSLERFSLVYSPDSHLDLRGGSAMPFL